jgi:hypothetical protein
MKKTKHIEKLIPLYFYDELREVEKQQVQAHIEDCELCRQRFEETQLLHETLDRKILMQPSEQTLTHARAQLRERLRQENLARLRDPWWQRLSDVISNAKPAWQLAGAAALLAIGVLAGKLVWAPSEARQTFSAPVASIESQEAGAPFISNIDLIEYDPQTGNVTIKYKSISDMLVQGKADDEPIRNLLAHAIRTEGNPGRRLAAVKAVSGQISSDAELEKALIHALENDTVDGVRLRAAQALRSFPINDIIKKAFIRALMKDPNPSIRIVAVEALSQVKEAEDVLPVFQDVARDDENDFIRLKTSSALERLENPKIEQ